MPIRISAAGASLFQRLALLTLGGQDHKITLMMLGFSPGRTEPALSNLRQAGLIETYIHEGIIRWRLTDAGKQLARLAWPPDGIPTDEGVV